MNRWLAIPILLAALALPAMAQQRKPPAEFGEVFPGGTFQNLNTAAGGATTVDLSAVIGKRPIVLCYWIAGNRRSEEMFQELQEIADEVGPTKLLLYGVVTERPGLRADKIVKQIEALKIRVPVLNDAGPELVYRLEVRAVPSISVIDGQGRLRLANAGSLRQTLEYNMDVATALRRVAETGELGTYGSLPRWYPVRELIGEKSPDFDAEELMAGTKNSWSGDILKDDQLNVLAFWSVDCPHCRDSLPVINTWYKSRGQGINLVSLAQIDGEVQLTKTREFNEQNGLAFPTYIDDSSVMERYKVVSTPTFVVVRPDGVVDSVIVSGQVDVGRKLEEKRKQVFENKGSGS